METSVPHISWKIFFGRLTPEGQRCLEKTLVDSGLLLGEYMELVERAYAQAFLLRQCGMASTDLRMDAEVIAVDLVKSYATRKRQFAQKTARSERPTSGQVPCGLPGEVAQGIPADLVGLPTLISPLARLQRRRQIHQRIEAMKRTQD